MIKETPPFDLAIVFNAYRDCRRRKRRSVSSLRFEQMYERNLLDLYNDIRTGRYHPMSSKAFIVPTPVQREVFAADFRDRIVHHLIIGQLISVFEDIFLDESYSCRVGKGTLFGVLSCADMMRECSRYYTSDCYVLKLDIHGFFFHIDKGLLLRKLTALVNEKYHHSNKPVILGLVEKILADDPVEQCKISGSAKAWEGLPPTKSLFHSEPNKGLPIGNLTSQIFANFYLNDFDHYVAGLDDNLFYGRYVDDMVLIHPSREYLIQVKELIRDYLKRELGLILHPKKVYLQHYGKGFAFIGAYIKPGRIYPGKRLRSSFYKKINQLNAQWAANTEEINWKLLESTLSSLNSYFGLLKHFDAWRVKLKGWNMLSPDIRNVFRTNERLNKVWIAPVIKKRMRDKKRWHTFAEPMRYSKRYGRLVKKLNDIDPAEAIRSVFGSSL